MRNLLLLAASLTSVLAFRSSTDAQNASNYTCALAIPLQVASGNVHVEFMPLVGKFLPGAEPVPVTDCSGTGTKGSGWYSFVATSASHWIRTEGDNWDESSLDVFSGTCGSLTSILCVPGYSELPEVTGLTPGQTYYLRVVMGNPFFCGPPEGCFLNLAVVSDPLNDECSGALELPVTTGNNRVAPAVEISTLGATQSQPGCAIAGAANDDVWYRFTATAATHFIRNQTMGGGAITVQGFSGTCGNLSNVFCNTDLATNLTIGQQYYLSAYSTSTDVAVSSRALIGVFEAAANDECAEAVPITVIGSGDAPVAVQLSTINATASVVPCGASNRDVWLSFVSPGTSVQVIGATQIARLLSGSCGSLTCIPSSTFDNSFDGLTAGAPYFLKIGADVSFANQSIRVFAPPTNDECADAVELPITIGDVASAFTHGHTFGATASPMPQTCGFEPKDIWFRFTATKTTHTIICPSSTIPTRTKVEVLSGTCGSLTSIACGFGIPNLPLTDLVIGNTYYVRTYGHTSLTGIRIAVLDPIPNDDCEGAIPLSFNTLEDYDYSAMAGNFLATDGTGTCGIMKDVWYRFTAAHTSAGFVAAGSGIVGGSVELLSGTCGSLTTLTCLSGLTSIVAKFTGLTVGSEYHLRVSPWNLSGSMFQPLLFDRPVHDEMAAAMVVPVGGSQFAQPVFGVWNYGATESYAQMCGPINSPDEDTWYRFTATAATHTIAASQQDLWYAATPLGSALRLEVYDTLSTDFATLDAGMFSCGNSPLSVTGLTVGEDYWYRVYTGQGGSESTSAFVTSVASGNNDEAAGALELFYANTYSVVFNTDGATQSQPGAACSVADFADDDIWFKFVATTANARVVVAEHNEDVTLELFSGTPGNLLSIACSDNILIVPTLTAGQTYYARLYSWKNAADVTGRVGLFITPNLTANTCVEETCLGPVLLSNPSIEQGAYCLPHISEITNLDGLGSIMAPGWPRYALGSSDSFSSCANVSSILEVPAQGLGASSGAVLSRSGKGMAGIIAKEGNDYYEYISAPLSEPLVSGEAYLVSFHIRSGTVTCMNGFGAALTQGPIVWNYDVLPIAPQVFSDAVVPSGEWTNICGIIVPTGAVDHITLGSFNGSGQVASTGISEVRAYYFIDDVVVALVADPSCITSIGDVPPLDEDTATSGDNLRIYPNPANDRVTIVADAMLFGERGVIEVFDATGRRLHAEQVSHFGALQPLELPAEWRDGLYLVMVRMDGQAPRTARVVLKR